MELSILAPHCSKLLALHTDIRFVYENYMTEIRLWNNKIFESKSFATEILLIILFPMYNGDLLNKRYFSSSMACTVLVLEVGILEFKSIFEAYFFHD